LASKPAVLRASGAGFLPEKKTHTQQKADCRYIDNPPFVVETGKILPEAFRGSEITNVPELRLDLGQI
jgi:hypothetical protein